MVTFFFRKTKSGFYSIEEVFTSVQNALPDDIDFRNHYLQRAGANIGTLLINGIEARSSQNMINHITGDIHYIAPFLKRECSILTIHDLRPLERGSFIKRHLLKLLWFKLPVSSVSYVTVISQETKKQLLKHVKVKPEKIIVIPNGISPLFTFSPQSWNTKKPRILHLGTKENKNLERLVIALKGIHCHLRIIGKLTLQQEELLKNVQVDYSNSFDLTSEQIVDEYKSTDLVSFISLYEGFGLPIIEAQATGRPVITSNISSMPEVAGTGALLVDPLKVQEIRNGIVSLFEDESLRQKLIEKGLENVKRFQAKVIAEQYADLYREVMKANS